VDLDVTKFCDHTHMKPPKIVFKLSTSGAERQIFQTAFSLYVAYTKYINFSISQGSVYYETFSGRHVPSASHHGFCRLLSTADSINVKNISVIKS